MLLKSANRLHKSSITDLTRVPVIEVSTSIATHSRVQSSTIVRQRSRRPSAKPSGTFKNCDGPLPKPDMLRDENGLRLSRCLLQRAFFADFVYIDFPRHLLTGLPSDYDPNSLKTSTIRSGNERGDRFLQLRFLIGFPRLVVIGGKALRKR
jgi:hypothetical protein